MTRHATLLPILTAFIFCVGLLMVFNTTSAEVIDRELAISPHHAFFKQLTFAIFGLILCFFIREVGVERLFESSHFLLRLGTIILILTLIPGIGQKINGARRWIGVGPFSFQPSEFMKIILPLYAITFLSLCREVTLGLFLKLLLRLSFPILLILLEPDNGTTAMLLATLCVLFFVTKTPWRFWAFPLILLAFFGVLIGSQMPHVVDRIKVYLNPELDLLGRGHQPYQAKIAAGSGGLTGRGLGESLQKLNYLPEARSDYIAAIFAEEFGFLGITSLVLVYMGLGYLGYRIALSVEDERASSLAAVLTFLIVFQGFINLGVVSGLLPSKGTNLPFFSQGGSSLLANMVAVTVIYTIGRESCRIA